MQTTGNIYVQWMSQLALIKLDQSDIHKYRYAMDGVCMIVQCTCSRVNPSVGHGQVQAVCDKYPKTYKVYFTSFRAQNNF